MVTGHFDVGAPELARLDRHARIDECPVDRLVRVGRDHVPVSGETAIAS